MWSKKPMPVSMCDSPAPVRARVRSMSVSEVLRFMCAVREDIGVCLFV